MPSSTHTQDLSMDLQRTSKMMKLIEYQVTCNSISFVSYAFLSFHLILIHLLSFFLSNAEHPNVISVFLNKRKELHTTRSWGLLGFEQNGRILKESLMYKARFGKDVIVANFDTGNVFFFIFYQRIWNVGS